MATWTLCHAPDFVNKESGMFVRNPFFKHTRRFWHDSSTGKTQSSGDPPSLHQKNNASSDQVVVGIEVDSPSGSQRYTVSTIMVDCSAKTKSAGQSSPFRGNGRMLCTISAPPATTVPITDSDGVVRYFAILGLLDLNQDATVPTDISEYELTIVATLADSSTGNLYVFSIDPEMDVDNTP